MTGAVVHVKEAAEILGLPLATVYQYTARRQVPHYKVGRHLLFKVEELTAWLAEHRREVVTA